MGYEMLSLSVSFVSRAGLRRLLLVFGWRRGGGEGRAGRWRQRGSWSREHGTQPHLTPTLLRLTRGRRLPGRLHPALSLPPLPPLLACLLACLHDPQRLTPSEFPTLTCTPRTCILCLHLRSLLTVFLAFHSFSTVLELRSATAVWPFTRCLRLAGFRSRPASYLYLYLKLRTRQIQSCRYKNRRCIEATSDTVKRRGPYLVGALPLPHT